MYLMCTCPLFQGWLPGGHIILHLVGRGGWPADTLGAARSVGLSLTWPNDCSPGWVPLISPWAVVLLASIQGVSRHHHPFVFCLHSQRCWVWPLQPPAFWIPLILVTPQVQLAAGASHISMAGSVVCVRHHIHFLVQIFIEIIVDSYGLLRNSTKRSCVRLTQFISMGNILQN